MIVGSFQDIVGILKKPPNLIPRNVTTQNYTRLMLHTPFLRWTVNTLIIAAIVLFLCVSINTMAGFAFSFYNFRFKKVLYWAFIASIMIPRQTLIIPLFAEMKALGLATTRIGAIVPLIFNPVGIIVVKTYVDSIPKSFIEIARMDGAKEYQILQRIIIPIALPAMATIAILMTLGVFTDYLWQSLILTSRAKQTLIVGLIQTIQNIGVSYEGRLNPIGTSLAAGTILFIPMLILFCFFQRYFISGIQLGGVKE